MPAHHVQEVDVALVPVEHVADQLVEHGMQLMRQDSSDTAAGVPVRGAIELL